MNQIIHLKNKEIEKIIRDEITRFAALDEEKQKQKVEEMYKVLKYIKKLEDIYIIFYEEVPKLVEQIANILEKEENYLNDYQYNDINITMKKKFANFLIWLYKRLIGRKPCIVYARPYKYTNRKDGFSTDCPFCKPEKDLIVEQRLYWNIIKNKYPYPHCQEHLLVVPQRHITKWKELTFEELEVLHYILTDYLDNGFLLLCRHFWGHPEASVKHLHLHLIKEEK